MKKEDILTYIIAGVILVVGGYVVGVVVVGVVLAVVTEV